jgi:hypothetical protein
VLASPTRVLRTPPVLWVYMGFIVGLYIFLWVYICYIVGFRGYLLHLPPRYTLRREGFDGAGAQVRQSGVAHHEAVRVRALVFPWVLLWVYIGLNEFYCGSK